MHVFIFQWENKLRDFFTVFALCCSNGFLLYGRACLFVDFFLLDFLKIAFELITSCLNSPSKHLHKLGKLSRSLKVHACQPLSVHYLSVSCLIKLFFD